MVGGAKFETQCIWRKSGSDSKNVVFNFKKTSNGFVFFDEKDLSPRTGPYHIPRATNYESVASFYYPFQHQDGVLKRKKVLLLFHMTESLRDRVEGNKIVTTLEAIGLMDKVMIDPERVALIFVRVGDNESGFTDKQEISWEPSVDTELVDIIPDISNNPAKKEALDEVQIKTLGDLRKESDRMCRSKNHLLNQCVEDYKKFEERQKLTSKMLAKIPQYVWKM
ncbi:hypothetical protein PHMEG_00038888 [Phytophthora megakarya]|uniref:Uncharacterized protein n=1 Tax=Phytophthora megakarya TaxID=4795 RepID=A0A225UGY8_9STRA|nr:hypothetical protein PHMEG_00038888 [Phytophthora megakarya]